MVGNLITGDLRRKSINQFTIYIVNVAGNHLKGLKHDACSLCTVLHLIKSVSGFPMWESAAWDQR